MAAQSDRLLVEAIRSSGPERERAWAEVVRRYEGRVRAFVRNKLKDRSNVDDVVQETFVGLFHSLANFDSGRELQTWLFTIASHKVTDQLRRGSRRPPGAAGGEAGDDDPAARAADFRHRRASSAARGNEKQELESAAVTRALRDLLKPFQDKGDYKRVMVLELLFVKGWPNQRVAQVVGVSDQQVANYRFAAVRKLGELLRAASLSPEVFPELRE